MYQSHRLREFSQEQDAVEKLQKTDDDARRVLAFYTTKTSPARPPKSPDNCDITLGTSSDSDLDPVEEPATTVISPKDEGPEPKYSPFVVWRTPPAYYSLSSPPETNIDPHSPAIATATSDSVTTLKRPAPPQREDKVAVKKPKNAPSPGSAWAEILKGRGGRNDGSKKETPTGSKAKAAVWAKRDEAIPAPTVGARRTPSVFGKPRTTQEASVTRRRAFAKPGK